MIMPDAGTVEPQLQFIKTLFAQITAGMPPVYQNILIIYIIAQIAIDGFKRIIAMVIGISIIVAVFGLSINSSIIQTVSGCLF